MSPIATLSRRAHTISVLVDNEPGILARVVGLFSGRGYNIESLTVAETDAEENLSRITIVTNGTPMVIEQIKAQLDRLVPVHRVRDLTVEGPHIERELALVKVRGIGDKRVEALRLADVFRAKVIDAKTDRSSSRSPARPTRSTTFVGLMADLGLVDVAPHRHRRHVARRRGAVIVDYVVALLGLALVHLLAVASPGPSTVLVIQTAAGSGRRAAGFSAAFAMMLGALVWAAAALYGLQALFARFGWLYLAFRIGGAAYLLYLAFMLWRHAGAPLAPMSAARTAHMTGWQGFLRALLLQMSNPKIMVFFGSIFLSLLPAQSPGWLDGAALAIVAVERVHLVRAAGVVVLGRERPRFLSSRQGLARSPDGRRAGAAGSEARLRQLTLTA